MSFIAGGYTCSFDGDTVGQIEDGIEFEWVFNGEVIKGDNLGDSMQDGVYRGGDCFCSMTLTEYDQAKLLKAIWPWSPAGAGAANFGRVGTVGVLATSAARTLILTKVIGPNASPTSITCTANGTTGGAILPFGFPIRLLLAPRLRRIPLRLQLLPYSSGSNTVWFVPA